MQRRDVILASVGILLVALVRLSVPSSPHLRRLSVEGMWLKLGPVGPGEIVTKTTTWNPPEDVYLLGWNTLLNADGLFDGELMLYDDASKTVAFTQGARPGASWQLAWLPPGAGFRINKGKPITFRARITNVGTKGFEPTSTSALLYFVPVEGN